VTPLGRVILRRKNEPERQVVPIPPPPIPASKPKRRPKTKTRRAGPVWDATMTRAELVKIALAAGLVVKYRTKKPEIIAMLEGIK